VRNLDWILIMLHSWPSFLNLSAIGSSIEPQAQGLNRLTISVYPVAFDCHTTVDVFFCCAIMVGILPILDVVGLDVLAILISAIFPPDTAYKSHLSYLPFLTSPCMPSLLRA